MIDILTDTETFCTIVGSNVKYRYSIEYRYISNTGKQRLTLTFQIKESFGLLTFHIKKSE